MTHPCITATQNTLHALRGADLSGHIGADTHLSPGVYFSADTIMGAVDITLHPLESGLLKAEMKVTGDPGWMSLNIALGIGTFNTGDVVGLTADLRGADTFTIRPFIRSARDHEEYDTLLAEDLTFGDTPGISTLLHTVTPHDALSYGEAYHTLIMPLPKRNLTLTLHDLRLLHVDTALNAGKPAMTLGGRAG